MLLFSLNNLSTEGSAAFILAIVFTILSVAGVIIFAKHIQMNKVLLAVLTLILPFLAVFCWVYLILDILKFGWLENLGISLGAAGGYVVIALAIAFIISLLVNRKKKEDVEEIQEEATAGQEQAQTVQARPILLENTQNQDVKLVKDAPKDEEPVVEEVSEATAEDTTAEATAEEASAEEATEEPKDESANLAGDTIINVVMQNDADEEENEDEEQGVVFSNEPRKTFAEQLADLKYETRSAYEEILAYAQAQDGTKTKEAKYQVTVSVGRMKLVLFKFIRGALVSSFMAGSSELKNYSAAEKAVKIKEKPVLIEVGEGDSVAVAKNMVDIVYKNITDAKQELKENKKAERRAKKMAQSIAEGTTEEVSTEEAPKKKRGRKKKSETQPSGEEQ